MNISRRKELEEKKVAAKKMRKVWRARTFAQITVFYENKILSGVTEDLGEGGLQFEISEELPVNSIILVQIPAMSFEKIQTKILDSNVLKTGSVVYRGQFININPHLKNELLKFVFKRLKGK